MYCDYKVVAVTPAGRRRYLSVLASHILSYRDTLDEWHLWLNTADPEDVAYIRKLSNDFSDFIKVKEIPGEVFNPLDRINRFFKDCVDENAIYIRFDDDIVYIHEEAICHLLDFRYDNPDYFLVFANIINNAICSHIHQEIGAIPKEFGSVKFQCLDPVGWGDPQFAEKVHNRFLQDVEDNQIHKYEFDRREVEGRFSINCFAFFGSDFARFQGEISTDEEADLTERKPLQLKKKNVICGNAIVSHFAFFTQRMVMDRGNILSRYRHISIL